MVARPSLWGRRRGYEVLNIFTWKEPLDLAYSQWKRGRPVERALQVFESHYGRLLGLGVPFVSLEIGACGQAPQDYLKRLCAITGVPYREGMEELNGEAHFLFGSGIVKKRLKDPGFFLGGWAGVGPTLRNSRKLPRP